MGPLRPDRRQVIFRWVSTNSVKPLLGKSLVTLLLTMLDRRSHATGRKPDGRIVLGSAHPRSDRSPSAGGH